MKKRFKRGVWKIYETEYKFFKRDEPNPQISTCRLSLNMLGLGIASLVIALIMLVVGVISLFVASVGWFLGYSPQPIRWFFADTLCGSKTISFWRFEGFEDGIHYREKYYKLNKRIAPWQVVFFPLALIILMFEQPVVQTILKTIWSPASWIFTKARGMRCPMPLDFSDVADIKHPDTATI